MVREAVVRFRAMTSWVPGSLSVEGVARLAEGVGLGFAPRTMRGGWSPRRTVKVTQQAWARLLAEGYGQSLDLEGEGGDLQISYVAMWGMEILIWTLDQWPNDWATVLDEWSLSPGFTAGYVGDPDDQFWQSADHVSTYELFQRPVPTHKIVTDPETQWQRIDVSGNPGRMIGMPGFWFCAGASIWLAPPSFPILAEHRLRAFAGAVPVATSSTIRIDLFDAAAPEATIRARQQALLDHLDLDAVLAGIDPSGRQGDASVRYAIRTEGPVRLEVTRWFTADGHTPSRRSAAAQEQSTTYRHDGSLMEVREKHL